MQSCTSTNWMSVIFSAVSSSTSRRNAASEVSPHLILPPGMPHLIRPFVRADHQHFVAGIENQRADRRERRPAILQSCFTGGLMLKIVLLQARRAIRRDARRSNPAGPRAIAPACYSRSAPRRNARRHAGRFRCRAPCRR